MSRLSLSLPAALRRPTGFVVVGVVLTALLAGGFAWSNAGQSATLSVDGQSREVGFSGDTVADVLAAAGLTAGPRDLLVPSAETAVEDGDRIALRRGRQIELVVDGQKRMVWVTAASVDEALDQVGLREDNLVLSASRSRGIPLEGFSLQVTTPKNIAVIADNATQQRDTTAATVSDALAEFGVALDGDDRVSYPVTDPIAEGLIIRVTRIGVERAEQEVSVPFETERRNDPEMAKGESKELVAGQNGLARQSVERVYGDGVLEKTTVLSSETITAPVKRVVAVGTKAPVRAATPRGSTGGADGLNWAALARCESGGNPRAVSPSGKYRGLYQFSMTTWRSVGGSGDPIDNSAEEQTYRAKVLFNRSGSGQWPHCGSRLYS